jgi:predicted metal-binding membrane protein
VADVDARLESLVRRERALTLGALAVLVALAWIYFVRLGRNMTAMAGMGMAVDPWTARDAALAAAMWATMMVAMMLPAAAPMILMFTGLNRRRRERGERRHVDTPLFVLGYLVIWSAFSIAAAAAQWGLQRAALLGDDAMAATPFVAAALLLVAAIYQVTPLKYACLARCRTPLGFLMTEWREGAAGAFVMGLRHGLFCLGCCWALMALLFVGGVMNLTWVAALTVFVLIEKLIPAGRLVSWPSAMLLLAWAAWIVLHATR